MSDKYFTQDWFSGNIPIWNTLLDSFKNKPNLNFLEIGCWEGKATLWLLENILTHESSKISVIDTFEGSPEEDGMKNLDLENIFNIFKHNTQEYNNKINVYKGYSNHILKQLGNKELFDFVYIDASHTAYGVLEDAVLVHPLVKKEGIIVFDDYEWKDYTRPSPTDSPKLGITCFFNTYADFYEVIFVGYQVGLRKIK